MPRAVPWPDVARELGVSDRLSKGHCVEEYKEAHPVLQCVKTLSFLYA